MAELRPPVSLVREFIWPPEQCKLKGVSNRNYHARGPITGRNMRQYFASLLLMTSLLLLPVSVQAVDEPQALRLLALALDQVDDPVQQAALLRGMLAGLAGRRDVTPPDAWAALAARLGKSENAQVRELTSQLSEVFGDESATQRALSMIQDRSADVADRRRALYSLLQLKNKQVSSLLLPLLDEEALRMDAIRGYAAIENPQAAKLLLERYPKLPMESRKAILETLATRKPYAQALLRAIKAKQVPRADIPTHVARSLRFLLGDDFVSVFGDVRQLSQDRESQIKKYKQLLTPTALADGDAARGRAIYNKTCASCHTLYGAGGKIGPDLTGSNRANLDYILLNSVDPSYDVPEGYKMVIIQTVDGRVLNGVIAEENAQNVVLKTVEQPRVVVLKKDIEVRRISPKSMMPDGQLDQMKPQDVINLIKYLQTIEQVEVAE